MTEQCDIFISHASEDKRAVVLPLVAALKQAGLTVWVDAQELQLGDSLHERISDGLRKCRCGLVVLSPDFLAKEWPMRELRALLVIEENSPKRIIFVRYGLSRNELVAKEPLIADRLDIEFEAGLDLVVGKIADVIQPKQQLPFVPLAIDISHGQSKWNDLISSIDAYPTSIRKIANGILEEKELLSGTSVLIMPPPENDRHRLTIAEMDEIERWIAKGGGLLLMGYYAERHHASNISELAWRFDFAFNDGLVLPAGQERGGHAQVFSTDPRYAVKIAVPANSHSLLAGIDEIAFISAASVQSTTLDAPDLMVESPNSSLVMRPFGHIQPNGSRPAVDWAVDRQGAAPVLAARNFKKGKVLVLGTWKIFTVDQCDNAKFVRNMFAWLAAPAS